MAYNTLSVSTVSALMRLLKRGRSTMLRRDPEQPWHPSYWLAALGAGGLSVSFFMYLMWMVPHAGFPMPTWEHISVLLQGTVDLPTGVRPLAILAIVAMV